MEPSAPQSPVAPLHEHQTHTEPEVVEPAHGEATVVRLKHSWNRKQLLIIGLVLVLIAAGAAWLLNHNHKVTGFKNPATHKSQTKATATAKVEGLQLDPGKNYGDKYANGLLPVGDGKYTTSSAKQGTVYACSQYANNLSQGGGGASVRGPWFTNNNTQYDISKKAHINGSVSWQPSFANAIAGSTHTITTNDLPNHTTGVFPVAASDPAYAYDRNPNTIRAQNLSYALPANPTYGSPNCMGGQVGVMLTGVALFNGFDAGGRDAGAWEVQDSCSGHPERQGEYHYHTLSSCIKDTSVHTVIGYALDGFPITGPNVGSKNILTTTDLDECHGIVSAINLDNKQVTSYHYVMTQDFPYSASCFRGQAIQPPGMP